MSEGTCRAPVKGMSGGRFKSVPQPRGKTVKAGEVEIDPARVTRVEHDLVMLMFDPCA